MFGFQPQAESRVSADKPYCAGDSHSLCCHGNGGPWGRMTLNMASQGMHRISDGELRDAERPP